jgi:inorganic pyrophosphatase
MKKSTKKKRIRSMADPQDLQPFDKDEGLLQVIIETPKGSPNKYSFDADLRIFKLKAALPSGMSFPYDFGFLPRTIAPDGDPIDVLVLMDESVFPGCMVTARLIGVICGEQVEGKKRNRNDRLIAVADQNTMFTDIKKLDDLPKHFMRELEEFFVNYHRPQGHRYKLLGCKGAGAAMTLIKKARKAA